MQPMAVIWLPPLGGGGGGGVGVATVTKDGRYFQFLECTRQVCLAAAVMRSVPLLRYKAYGSSDVYTTKQY